MSRSLRSPRREVGLRVDWIRCDGYGLCGDLLPDLIALDEWRYPIVPSDPIPPGRRHDVQRAIDCCPMRALRFEPVPAEERPSAAGHSALDAARPAGA